MAPLGKSSEDLLTSRIIGPLLKTLVFLVIVAGTLLGAVPYWLMGRSFSWPASWVHWLAVISGALGLAILLRCMWEFISVGLGTPAPIDPPKSLVATGLYRFVRNPMYVGVMTTVLSEAAFFGSLRILEYALVIWGMVFLFVLGYEEPTLRKKFGASYEAYCRGVPRWIPRLTLWRGER
jgi:protein-S-isoprenylcysteine O-methyltransferase Ste14